MYETDAMARWVVDAGIRLGHDQAIKPTRRGFVHIPFRHSENLSEQKRTVTLAATLSEEVLGDPHHRTVWGISRIESDSGASDVRGGAKVFG